MQTTALSFSQEPTMEDTAFYGDYWHLLEDVVNEFLCALSQMRHRDLRQSHSDPVLSCPARIKSARSIQEKLERYGWPVSLQGARDHVFDAAGVRVICPFVEDIHRVVRMIHTLRGAEILQEKDYVRHPKDNGYRSYHMILRVPLRAGEEVSLPLEVQIRTLAMDCWASIEHSIKYKQVLSGEHLLTEELRRCASELAAADLSLQTLREWVRDAND